ncbi:MAG: twin-arginine translocation pathway signal protein, partial [Alphaproteobacteria bacterium]
MTSRRNVLMLVGGGFVLAAGAAGAGAYAWASGQNPSTAAREAWTTAGQPKEYRRRFLSYALLAPNPHNRQPWKVKLIGDDQLALYCDLDRRLDATDPLDRQITLGCGGFLELLRSAAASEGYTAQIVPFPEGEPQPRLNDKPIAHVRFTEGTSARDPAFEFITKRVTNREIYEDKAPDDMAIASLMVAGSTNGVQCRATADPERVAAMRDLTWKAYEREATTPAANTETAHLLRIGRQEVEKYRDGIALEGPAMEAMKAAGMLSEKAMEDPNSMASSQGREMWKAKAMSARGFAWLFTEQNDRYSQLAAGSAYARMSLKAAELDLAIHPWSQALQEYPEMKEFYSQAQSQLGEGGVVQMLVRVGYAKP